MFSETGLCSFFVSKQDCNKEILHLHPFLLMKIVGRALSFAEIGLRKSNANITRGIQVTRNEIVCNYSCQSKMEEKMKGLPEFTGGHKELRQGLKKGLET